MITCTSCNTIKPDEAFPKYKHKKNGRGSWCRECVSEHKKAHYSDDSRSKRKAYHLYLNYDISLQTYEKMLADQNNSCGICEEPLSVPCVDHNHSTGQVRGLLCHNCNQALGKFKDDIQILEKAANYLKQHS